MEINEKIDEIIQQAKEEKAYMEAGIYKPKENVYRFTEDQAEICSTISRRCGRSRCSKR